MDRYDLLRRQLCELGNRLEIGTEVAAIAHGNAERCSLIVFEGDRLSGVLVEKAGQLHILGSKRIEKDCDRSERRDHIENTGNPSAFNSGGQPNRSHVDSSIDPFLELNNYGGVARPNEPEIRHLQDAPRRSAESLQQLV